MSFFFSCQTGGKHVTGGGFDHTQSHSSTIHLLSTLFVEPSVFLLTGSGTAPTGFPRQCQCDRAHTKKSENNVIYRAPGSTYLPTLLVQTVRTQRRWVTTEKHTCKLIAPEEVVIVSKYTVLHLLGVCRWVCMPFPKVSVGLSEHKSTPSGIRQDGSSS